MVAAARSYKRRRRRRIEHTHRHHRRRPRPTLRRSSRVVVKTSEERCLTLLVDRFFFRKNKKYSWLCNLLPLRRGNCCSSTSCEFLYLELPCDFFVFFLSDRFAKGSILSTNVVVDMVLILQNARKGAKVVRFFFVSLFQIKTRTLSSVNQQHNTKHTRVYVKLRNFSIAS